MKQRVFCDACGRRFKPRSKIEQDMDIQRVYIKCPKCKKEYTAYYTDTNIRAKQALVRTMRQDYQRLRGNDPPGALDAFTAMQRLTREIGRDMERLKQKMGN